MACPSGPVAHLLPQRASSAREERPVARGRSGRTFTWLTFGAPCTSTVTEFEPFERFAFTGGGMGAVGHHAWVLTDDGEGGTIIHTEETQRGKVIALLGPVLQSWMRSQHQKWVDNLARTAETGRRP